MPQSEGIAALSEILPTKTLVGFQTGDLALGLYYGNGVCCWDTGMGKTLWAAAIMKAYTNEVRTRKFIYLCKAAQITQSLDELREYTGLRVEALSGVKEEFNYTVNSGDFRKAEILIVSHSLMSDPDFMRFFYNFKDDYFGVIVDEIHELSNYPQSISGSMTRALLRNYKVRFGMTATPITSDPSQAVHIASMIDWEQFGRTDEVLHALKYSGDVSEVFGDLFLIRRRDVEGILSNYIVDPILVDAHPHQIGARGSVELFRKTKAKGAYNQINKVLELVHKHQGQKGLIYCHYSESMDWVCDNLDAAGIKYRRLDGKTSKKNKDKYLKELKENEVMLLVTSLTTGLHMQADFLIYYEYTTSVKQMLGRSDRGLNPKTLYIYFIFTRDTDERDYFYRNIYKLAWWIQEVFKQDYSVFVGTGQRLGR
jgi:superfamily II DNA or RNA helicase